MFTKKWESNTKLKSFELWLNKYLKHEALEKEDQRLIIYQNK